MIRENEQFKAKNIALMEITEQLEQQLNEERQNANNLLFQTQKLLVNIQKANDRAAKAENTLDNVENQVLIIE